MIVGIANNSPVTQQALTHLWGTHLKSKLLPAEERELVQLATSYLNNCLWCVKVRRTPHDARIGPPEQCVGGDRGAPRAGRPLSDGV